MSKDFTLYIFQLHLILFFVFVYDFVKNNHDCLGVMQSLLYKSPSKLFLNTDTERHLDIERETQIQRYRPQKIIEHYNINKE